MEPRFGHDLSVVRVHAGAGMHRRAARRVRAGRCAPHAPDGRAPLAHELVHTIQQANVGTRTLADAPRRAAIPSASRRTPELRAR